MKGRCIVLESPCKTKIMEFDVPHPEAGAVVLKMHRCSICASDTHIWRGEHPNPQYSKNFVMGHEGVGEILELGAGVTADWAGQPVEIGDRVIFAHYVRCHKCYNCMHGFEQICVHNKMDYFGDALQWPHFSGTFGSHFYILPIQPFYKLPDEVPDTIVASMNCAMATAYASVDRSRLTAGENIVILGAGTLGLHATAISHRRGAKVIVVEEIPERIQLAKEFGADDVIDLKEYKTREALVARAKDLTNGIGPEVVIELCGQGIAHEEAFEILAPGGRFIPTGIAWANIKVNLTPSYNMRKMVDVLQSFHYKPIHLYQCIQFLKENMHSFPYEKLCDAEFSFDQFDEVLQLMAERKVIRPVLIP